MGQSPTQGVGGLLRKRMRQSNEVKTKKKSKSVVGRIQDFPFFRAIKPKSKYIFKSDYFQIDQAFAVVLTIMHNAGSDDSLGYFWGIQLIPRDLSSEVSVRRLEHFARMSESWIDSHQGRAEGLLNTQAGETGSTGSMTSKQKLSKRQHQLVDVANDLMEGATYLRVAIRLLVKAPSLEKLDDAVQKINRQYKDRFDTVFASPYVGEQKREFSNLFAKVDRKMGRNFMFTSAELAGNYSLVTRGIEDAHGEFVGLMGGDVNNSPVIMDVDRYDSHVVLAGRLEAKTLSDWDFHGQRGVDVWGVKLGMAALVRNRRVIHLVLNRAKVPNIGVDLSDITSVIDMTKGDINPFEFFGESKDEPAIFAAHQKKWALMVQQLHPMDNAVASRVVGELQKTMVKFYVDRRMWSYNAQKNRDNLRLVDIPHDQIPMMPEFVAYLDVEYKAHLNDKNHDESVLQAYGILRTVFQDMLDTNGDLFDTQTSDRIDLASVSSRVVYDFHSLAMRGVGVMMAQFVNAIGFAVGNLKKGDLVVLHGVEMLSVDVKEYVRRQFDQLGDSGVRIAYVYGSVDRMIEDRAFNAFDRADYTLLGGMTKSTIAAYEEALKQEVPIALRRLLEHKDPLVYYLRRNFDNVVFSNDVQVGLNRLG